MGEDDGNPYDHETHITDCFECQLFRAYAKGQLHPSPQTIKKIEIEILKDFVFSLKEAIKHKWLGWEYIQSDLGKVKAGKGEITLHEIHEAIDNTFKQQNQED